MNDTADDTVVTVAPSPTAPTEATTIPIFTRPFAFPQDTRPGWYSITCSIWLGQPGSGTVLDSITQTRAIYVGTDDPSMQPYTGNNFIPDKIAFDRNGKLGVTDSSSGCFLEFSPPFGSRGLFTVFNGQLGSGNLGSGWGRNVVTGPRPSWAIDSCGNIWFVDTANSQIFGNSV